MELRLSRRLPLSMQLVGIDGGATHVRAVEVTTVQAAGHVRLRAGQRVAKARHRGVPGFETPAERGLTCVEELGDVTPAEREQGWAWVESTARCLVEIARARAAARVLVGIAFPGTKTPDRRGIAFALNGPRVPEFVESLTRLVESEGVELAAPIVALESDGLCAGIGEQCAEAGGLVGLRNAYYVGGGTGLAESLVLAGELVTIDAVEAWFPRAWRMRWNDAPLESWLAASGINRRWAESAGFELPLEPERLPEERLRRDPRARELFESVGEALAHLVGHRMVSLAAGIPPEVGIPAPQVLERVVIGQQLGRLFDDARTQGALRASFENALDAHLRRTGLDAQYPPDGGAGRRRRELVQVSKLEHAAALGAAALALNAWSRERV